MKQFLLLLMVLPLSAVSFAQQPETKYQASLDKYEEGKYKTALQLAEEALAGDSTQSRYFSQLALCQEKLAMYEEAEKTYRLSIKKMPDTLGSYINLGTLLTSIGKPDQAIRVYNKGYEKAQVDSQKVEFLNNRAVSRISQRNFKLAYADLQEAFKLDSTDIAVLINLGGICDEAGYGDQTLGYLERVLAIDSVNIGALSNIGYSYQQKGEYEMSNEYYNKVLSINPDEALGYSNRAYNQLMLGFTDEAMKDVEKSLKLYPTNAWAYMIRGKIYVAQQKFNKACEDFATARRYGYVQLYGNDIFSLESRYCQ